VRPGALVEWNHYFQGHPPSCVRGEFVVVAATLLLTCYNLSSPVCNLALKTPAYLSRPPCAQHFSTWIPVDKAVLPPHPGDRRNASYFSPRRSSLTPCICHRQEHWRIATQYILQIAKHCLPRIHYRIQLFSKTRSCAICCTTSHWLLVRARDSLDAIPRSHATNRPITRDFQTEPRELSCNNTIVSLTRHWSLRFTTAQKQATSSDSSAKAPWGCKVD
jgi:hypothetical protein